MAALWFHEGKIISDDSRAAIWKKHQDAWNEIYQRQCRLKARHREELAILDREFTALEQPYTPWVGHADDGPVEEFVNRARKEWEWRKEREKNEQSKTG